MWELVGLMTGALTAGSLLAAASLSHLRTSNNFPRGSRFQRLRLHLPLDGDQWPLAELRLLEPRGFGQDQVMGLAELDLARFLPTPPQDSQWRGWPRGLHPGPPPPLADWWTRYFASPDLGPDGEELLAEKTAESEPPPPKPRHHDDVRLNIGRHFAIELFEPPLPTGSGDFFCVPLKGKAVVEEEEDWEEPEPPPVDHIVKYPCELEEVEKLGGLAEELMEVALLRGRQTQLASSAADRTIATLKTRMSLSPATEESGGAPMLSTLESRLTDMEHMELRVRLYVIRAWSLSPSDFNGLADPYIRLKFGHRRIDDRNHYISRDLEPVFAKSFEFRVCFPLESALKIQVKDWDMISSDDLIGETVVDLEGRWLSRRQASCGLPAHYHKDTWRDWAPPSAVLERVCAERGLVPPEEAVRAELSSEARETAALEALRSLDLVPEHLETRTLAHPRQPDHPTGYLQLWIDLFPVSAALRAPVVVRAPEPEKWELRVVVRNVEEVLLDDEAWLTGQRMSDVFVRGFLGVPSGAQRTDVHYRSLSGEGNFNWRFVFPFHYLASERKVVEPLGRGRRLSLSPSAAKAPPVLTLEAWDADFILPNDRLGAIRLDLNSMPRGAAFASRCGLEMMSEGRGRGRRGRGRGRRWMSLFEQRRCRGWWPLRALTAAGEVVLAGKVEAEVELLTAEESAQRPAGLARLPPQALQPPHRPRSSFLWFLSPWKTVRFVVWRNHKRAILKMLLVLFLLVFFGNFITSIPKWAAKKMIGV